MLRSYFQERVFSDRLLGESEVRVTSLQEGLARESYWEDCHSHKSSLAEIYGPSVSSKQCRAAQYTSVHNQAGPKARLEGVNFLSVHY